MDHTFKSMCEFFNPKMTAEVMNGYVTHEFKSLDPKDEGYDLKGMEDRVNATLHKAFHGLLGGRLHYEGFERCTPQEEFDISTRPKNTKRMYELARSDFYMVKIKLSYLVAEGNRQPLPDTFLYLPNPGPAGLTHIGGPLFQFIPVVSDKVISPEEDYLFVRLEQYKMKFYCSIENYPIVVNDYTTHHNVYWANIYKQKQGKKKVQTTKALSTLVHYMLAREGFSKMFQKFAGFVPIVGEEDTVNSKTYNPEEWVVVRTAYDRQGIVPPTVMGKYYKHTKIRLAIPQKFWNEATQSLVHSFYYVVDAFADQLTVGNLDYTDVWKLTLGHIISDPKYSPGKIIGVVDEHFSSTDTYMDDLSIERLAEKGFHVETFNDLLGLIVTNYRELYSGAEQNQMVYGKYLDTMREVLYPITCSIYNTKYFLMKLMAKGKDVVPTIKAVTDVFTRKFKQGAIFKLTSKGIVAEIVSYSGDHKYLKITSRLSQQESTPGTRTSKGRKSYTGNAALNSSTIMSGSVLFLSKKKPVPMSHVNPFICLDLSNGTIIENPEYKEEMKILDEKLIL